MSLVCSFVFFLWAVKDEQVTNLGVIANTTFLQWHSHNLKMREEKKRRKKLHNTGKASLTRIVSRLFFAVLSRKSTRERLSLYVRGGGTNCKKKKEREKKARMGKKTAVYSHYFHALSEGFRWLLYPPFFLSGGGKREVKPIVHSLLCCPFLPVAVLAVSFRISVLLL